jgi:hypothetical protein
MSFGKYMGVFAGVVVAVFSTAFIADEVRDRRLEAKATENVAKTFNLVSSTVEDPQMPGKQQRLKEVYHHLSKYAEPEAQYLVSNNIRIDLSAAMADALYKVDQNAITINARADVENQKWHLAQAVDFISNQNKNGLPYAATCLRLVERSWSLTPTACS